MMCNSEFLSKAPDEAWDYFDYLTENAQIWDTTDRIDKFKPVSNPKGGMYLIREEDDINAKIASLTRKIEAMELQKVNMVKATKIHNSIYDIYESDAHHMKDCPTIPAFKEAIHNQTNATNAYQRPFSLPYSNTYNPNWQNHPNFSWRNDPSANANNEPQGPWTSTSYVPPQKRTLEDTLQAFMQG